MNVLSRRKSFRGWRLELALARGDPTQQMLLAHPLESPSVCMPVRSEALLSELARTVQVTDVEALEGPLGNQIKQEVHRTGSEVQLSQRERDKSVRRVMQFAFLDKK